MKKIILALAILSCAGSLRAQWYLGGAVGGSYTVTKDGDGNNLDDWRAISMLPEFGYHLNDRLAVGLSGGFSYSKNKIAFPQSALLNRSWNVTPYARYALVRYKKFDLIAKAAVSAGHCLQTLTGQSSYLDHYFTIPIEYDLYGAYVTPMLAYNLSGHLMLYTNLDFASLKYEYRKYEGGGKESAISFGADSNSAFNTGDINVGFIYKF